MEVIIVSKTKMASNECVGGILKNGQFVRLLDEHGNNQPIDCDFEIGDIWKIDFVSNDRAIHPHTEDILIQQKSYTQQKRFTKSYLKEWIESDFPNRIWRGNPDILFDSQIRFTPSGSGYVSHSTGVPAISVGFWISDKNLVKKVHNDKTKYNYPLSHGWRNITYVGKEDAIDNIPAGTLMRVSLARWWSPEDSDDEKRCYLQLSGWYLD